MNEFLTAIEVAVAGNIEVPTRIPAQQVMVPMRTDVPDFVPGLRNEIRSEIGS